MSVEFRGFAVYFALRMSLEIRAVIHFLWLKNFPNAEISREIDSIYGEDVIGLRAIQKWTHRFEDGDHSLDDRPKTGRPRSIKHVNAIRVLLVDDAYLSQKGLLSL
jgi:hypothetical protein